jgi:mRNA interferase RelE/StbE
VPEYQIAFKSSAEKELFRLPDHVISRIFPRIKALSKDALPHGSKKLIGGRDEWRIRIGDYRVVYTIDDSARQIDITRIPHRREGYDL